MLKKIIALMLIVNFKINAIHGEEVRGSAFGGTARALEGAKAALWASGPAGWVLLPALALIRIPDEKSVQAAKIRRKENEIAETEEDKKKAINLMEDSILRLMEGAKIYDDANEKQEALKIELQRLKI